jgi:hypothetical protein
VGTAVGGFVSCTLNSFLNCSNDAGSVALVVELPSDDIDFASFISDLCILSKAFSCASAILSFAIFFCAIFSAISFECWISATCTCFDTGAVPDSALAVGHAGNEQLW